MAEEKNLDRTGVPNTINDETGQYDARFLLWRMFCSENNIAVESLPSDLTGEVREKWEALKNNALHKPSEEGRTS